MRLMVVLAVAGEPLAASPDTPGAEEPIELPLLRVTGSRFSAETSGEGPGAAEVLSDDLLADGFGSVPEFLENLPGVYFNRDPGGAGASELFVRGGETNFTSVFVDGVKVNNVMDDRGGTFDLGLISPLTDGGVRLERGAGSAFRGSGALSGALAFESLGENADPGSLIWSRTDGPDAWSIGSRIRGTGGGWIWQGAGERSHFSWDEAARGAREAWQAGIAAKGSIGPTTTVAFSLRRMRAEATAFPADSGGWRYAAIRELESTTSDQALGSLRLRHAWEGGQVLRVRISGYGNDVTIDSPGVAPGARDPAGLPATVAKSQLRRSGLAVDYLRPITERWEVALGAEIERETGETRSIYDFGPFVLPADYAIGRTTYGLAGEVRWLGPSTEISYALRGDQNERDGSQWSQYLRLDWRPEAGALQLGLSAQDAFKYASLYALSNALVGNPGLRAEGAREFAAHLVLAPRDGTWTLDASAFTTAYEDLVDFDAGPPPQLVNRGRFRVSGFDVSGQLTVGEVTARGYLSLARPDLPRGAEPLRDRPEWRAGASLAWAVSEAVDLTLRVRYVGPRRGSSIATGDRTLGGEWTLDLSGSWELSEAWVVRGRLENALDAESETSVGNPGRGRTPWFEVLARF